MMKHYQYEIPNHSYFDLFPSGADGNDTNGSYPNILTPLIVSVGAIIIAFTVAKLVDCCCQRTLERNENLESLDDKTKKILRARLIVIQMKRKEMAKTAPALGIFKKWSSKTKVSKNLRNEASKKEKQTVITVEEANEEGKKANSTITGFLKTNKVSNGIPDLSINNKPQPIVHEKSRSDSDSHASNSSKTETPRSTLESSSKTETPRSSLESSNSSRSISSSSAKSVPISVTSTQNGVNSESGISVSVLGMNSDQRKPSNKSVTFNENVEVKTEDELEQLDSVKVVSETSHIDSNKPSNLKKPS